MNRAMGMTLTEFMQRQAAPHSLAAMNAAPEGAGGVASFPSPPQSGQLGSLTGLLPGAGEALRPELAAAQEDPMEAEIRRYLEAVMRGEAE